MKKIIAVLCAVAVCVASFVIYAYATDSIKDLHDEANVTVNEVSTDGTNTAVILAETGIYTNRAIAEQYMKTNEETGELEDTKLSIMVKDAESEIDETGTNGTAIVDDIPSVEEVLKDMSPNGEINFGEESGYDLSKLDQLTYMLDFKYVTTHYRVIAGVKVEYKEESVVLDNGMIEATIDGGEIMRSAAKEQFVIIQVDSVTEEVHFLTMKDYNAENGDYTVDFPCTGPYMICQIMDR